MQQGIDQRIKQAQRKGIGVYLLSGGITLVVLSLFLLWLFFVRGFNVIVGPSEAVDKANMRLLTGLAWVGETKVYTLGGEIELEVASPTFQTARVTINNQSPSTVEIQLLPSPAHIQATAVSEDGNFTQWQDLTQWFLNGKLVHVGLVLDTKTAPGNYQLDLSHPYYQNVSQSLQLSRAQTLNLRPTFEIINGSISIDSKPQGIAVSLDDIEVGQTPLVLNVKGGEHKIQLKSNEYETVTEVIPVSTGFLHPKRNYQLAPKPGVVTVEVSPAGGLLLINAVEYAPGDIPLAANKTHKVEYKKAGYSSFVKTIRVNPQEPLPLSIKLAPQFGQLSVKTNVPANIKLNGKVVSNGLSQNFEQRLSAVGHTIEASAEGYRSLKQSVQVKPNQTANINLRLLTEFEARRQEGKPLFVEQLGIQMKRFRADAFVMGSPDNETGRRRNEHQISVDFSRQFWVSETEITQGQFAAFTGNSQNKSKLPVTGVSWQQAAEYCNWLSEQEGLAPFYRFVNGRYAGFNKQSIGYRLPTEAEWEWLAKKSKRAASTVYVWGNQEKLQDKTGNFADKTLSGKQPIFFVDYEDGKTGVAEVASFKADRSGIYDLDGNVSEWVHDLYTNSLPDMSQSYVDYTGAPTGEAWVIKGGNFETGRLRDLRGAFREFASSGKETVGFRIARYHD